MSKKSTRVNKEEPKNNDMVNFYQLKEVQKLNQGLIFTKMPIVNLLPRSILIMVDTLGQACQTQTIARAAN